ncbi:unnamed protein product [Auanema sp. JU1783]|nr:unnamed protein product [Auanema sp. JU1783]
MQQSIVIKARVNDVESTENAIFDLTDSLGTYFVQEDVYFNVPKGYLKLRIMHPNRCGHLIFNSNSKMSGHKMSKSQITEVEDVTQIRMTLAAALSELGTIRKKRRIFTVDNLRIYLDEVDEMGTFIDVSLTMNTSDEEVIIKKVADIRQKLQIQESDIVPVAYLDLMMQKLSFDEDTSSDSKYGSSDNDSDSSS